MPDQEKLEHFFLPFGSILNSSGPLQDLGCFLAFMYDRGDGVPFQMHAKKVKAKK